MNEAPFVRVMLTVEASDKPPISMNLKLTGIDGDDFTQGIRELGALLMARFATKAADNADGRDIPHTNGQTRHHPHNLPRR